MHRFEQRSRSCLANLSSFCGRSSPDLFLDPVQLRDTIESFFGNRRLMRLIQIVKLAAHMRPTRVLKDSAVFVKSDEARIAIGLQDVAIVFQMICRMLAFAVR